MKYYWFVFCKTELLLEKTPEGQHTIPYGEQPPVGLKEWTTVHTVDIPEPLRSDDGATEVKTFRIDTPYQGQESTGKGQETNMEMCGLRASYHLLPRQLYLIAGKCQEILYWDANTRFCGVCGAPMKLHTSISKRCTECGRRFGRNWPLRSLYLSNAKPPTETRKTMKCCWFMPTTSEATSTVWWPDSWRPVRRWRKRLCEK